MRARLLQLSRVFSILHELRVGLFYEGPIHWKFQQNDTCQGN